MSNGKEMVRNVLIKDGNRTVNWDFPANSTVRDVLRLWQFEWEPDSVKINGRPVPDGVLCYPLANFISLWDGNIVITMVQKKKEPQKKEEADA